MREIHVKADWDAEAKVWVATSDDLPGLVTEAPTVEALCRKLTVMIPDLLEANGELDKDVREIPFYLIAHQQSTISLQH